MSGKQDKKLRRFLRHQLEHEVDDLHAEFKRFVDTLGFRHKLILAGKIIMGRL